MVVLAVFYYLAVQDYYQRHQPVSIYKPPHFLYPVIGDRFGRIVNPLGVYVAFGRLFTTSGNGQVVVTNREGGYYWSLNLAGKTTKNVRLSPRSVVVDPFGRIYVSAGPTNNILVYDYNGNFRYIFPQRIAPTKNSREVRAAKILNPVGLNYFDDLLIVTDVGDQTVKKFTTTGRQVAKFGGPGISPGKFSYPNGLARADDGKLYVADSNNSRVQVFGKDGRFLSYLIPPAEERFSLPRGIAIDKLGRIHVVDTLKSRVFVFSRDHKFLFTYGAGQENEGDLAYPNAIFIDRDTGLIFIADRLNNRVAVWAEK